MVTIVVKSAGGAWRETTCFGVGKTQDTSSGILEVAGQDNPRNISKNAGRGRLVGNTQIHG